MTGGEPRSSVNPGVPFPLKAAQQFLRIGAARQKLVDDSTQLRLVAGAALFRLMLDAALSLIPARDNDRHTDFLANLVTGSSDEMISPLIWSDNACDPEC